MKSKMTIAVICFYSWTEYCSGNEAPRFRRNLFVGWPSHGTLVLPNSETNKDSPSGRISHRFAYKCHTQMLLVFSYHPNHSGCLSEKKRVTRPVEKSRK